MSIRYIIAAGVAIALGIVLPAAGRAEGKLANNFVDVKLLFPVNGLEYEHVFSNAIGVSIAGSYLSVTVEVNNDDSDDAEDDVPSGKEKVNVRYTTFGGGIKKYFGDHRTFYLGAYVNGVRGKAKHEETVVTGEGSLNVMTVLGAVGGRGVLGHFTFGGEIGGGYLGFKDISYWGTDDDGETTKETLDLPNLSVGPMAQVYLGYAF